MKRSLKNNKILRGWLEQIELKDSIWREVSNQIYQNKLQLTDPVLVNINHLRQLFRFYLIPLIKQITQKGEKEQTRFLRFMAPVISAKQLDQFLEHFFSIDIAQINEPVFRLRDSFLEDVFILYDLYKSKITIELISSLLQELKKPETEFPSIFSRADQISILKNFRAALLVSFKQSLKNEYHKLYKTISLNPLSFEEEQSRRGNNIILHRPETLNGSPYRRVFFHLFFRYQLQTTHNGKKINIQHNWVDFEQIRFEYFSHWIQKLGDHPRKLEIYQRLTLQKTTFLDLVVKSQHPENSLLEGLDIETFSNITGELHELVEPEFKAKVTPISNHTSPLKELNSQFKDLVSKIRLQNPVRTSSLTQESLLKELSLLNNGVSNELPVNFACGGAVINSPTSRLNSFTPYSSGKNVKTEQKKIIVLTCETLLAEVRNNLDQDFYLSDCPLLIEERNRVTRSDLTEASLIILIRTSLPTTDKNKMAVHRHKLKAEILDIEMPLEDYDVPAFHLTRYNQEGWRQFLEIKEDLKKAKTEVFEQDRYFWDLRQEIERLKSKIGSSQRVIEQDLPTYHFILLGLILDSIQAAGHLSSLVKGLIGVNRYLVVDGQEEETKKFLVSHGFQDYLISCWRYQKLDDNIKSLRLTKKMTLTANNFFSENTGFQRYEGVFIVDWNNSTKDCVPVSVYHKSVSKEDTCDQIYVFNLLDFFDLDKGLADLCRQGIQNVYGKTVDPDFSPLSLQNLRVQIPQLNELQVLKNSFEDELNLEELQIDKFKGESYSKQFSQFLQQRFNFFTLAHSLKSS